VAATSVIAVAGVACTIAALDYSGKSCPCPSGWTCDTSSGDAGVCRTSALQGDAGGGTDAPPDEAAADAHADSPLDAPAEGSWCSVHAPGAFFCDDFDEEDGFGGKWSVAGNGGTASLDDALAVSPPNSLSAVSNGAVVAADASDGTVLGGPMACLTAQTPSATATAVHLQFDAYLPELQPIGDASGVYLTLVNLSVGGRTIDMLLYTDGLRLQESDPGSHQTHLAPPPSGAWTRVWLNISFGTSTATVKYATPPGDIPTVPDAGSRSLDEPWDSGTPSLQIGLCWASATQSQVTIHLDDIVFDIQ
jgi:hypothetical protein